MSGRSPVTVSYLQVLKKNYNSFSMFEEQLEYFDELIERAHHIDNSPSVERLRCFFIIEVVYADLIPRVLDQDQVGAAMKVFIPDDDDSPFGNEGKFVARSWEGLGKLLTYLYELDDHCDVLSIELRLFSKEAGSTAQLVRKRLFRAQALIQKTKELVEFLRPRLLATKPLDDLYKLGDDLGVLVTKFHTLPMEKQTTIALDLMTISLEDPKVPCHQMNESQE